MSKLKVVLLALTLSVLVFAALQAQQRTKGTLTALDYAEIQRLYGRYAIGYDSGNGDLFARAFTADGTFTIPTRMVVAGREKLTEFAGQPGGNKGPTNVLHVNSNITIEPSAEGATGTAYVLLVNIGQSGKPSALTGGGIYHDTFVKGPEGWRIKSRVFLPAHTEPPKSSAN